MIPSRGDEPGVYILGSDITKFKALQSQLEHEAAHDPLTGLPNRRAFTLRLSRELERVRQNAEPWACCSSISTASRGSTTGWDTTSAMLCCNASPRC